MRTIRPYKLPLGLFLACILTVGLAAQTSSTDTAAKPPEKAAETSPAPAPAPAPSPLAGITSVLGGVNLTGLADVYYGYNANHPTGTAAGNAVTEPFTPFVDQFGLNLVELQIDKPVDKTTPLGFRVALGFGQAMTAINNASFHPNDSSNASTQYLKEGYLSYMAPLGKGLQLDFGKYVTSAGAEVIETNQNWNYSRSLLFYFAIPYYHFGARAKYTFNDKWSITGFANNGWNNILAPNSGKTGGFSLAWNATKKLSLTETYLAGPGGPGFAGSNGNYNNLTDTVLAYNPNAKLSLVANFDYDHQAKFGDGVTFGTGKAADYTGIAAYAKYAFNPKVAVAGRFEYFNDHDGLATSGVYAPDITAPIVHNHINEFTGTIERRFAGHLISRLEYRHDDSNQNFFQRGGPSFVKGQTTVDAGLVFVLEPNDTK
jgi:Putative beta-barrel porin-2, OmpL-like. bbp2